MELSNEHKDRLKKALIAGTAAVAAGVIVKYFKDHEGDLKGFIYRFGDEQGTKAGIYRGRDYAEIIQISGTAEDIDNMVLDPKIEPADVDRFEELVALARQQRE